MKIKITKDCLCEHYLHEATNYPRAGLVKKEFKVGEVFEVESEWNNFYGSYYKILYKDSYADIAVHNAEVYVEPKHTEKNELSVKAFIEELKDKNDFKDLNYLLISPEKIHHDEAMFNLTKKFEMFLEKNANE